MEKYSTLSHFFRQRNQMVFKLRLLIDRVSDQSLVVKLIFLNNEFITRKQIRHHEGLLQKTEKLR